MAGRLGIFCHVFFTSVVLLAILIGGAGAQTSICGSGTGVCVQTWRQDINLPTGSACIGYSCRTGENLSETAITYGNLSTKTLGQRCSAALDGQVYAQPLIMTNVQFQNSAGNYYTVAYVVTQKDTLYAINAVPPSGTGQLCQVLGSLSLIPGGSPSQYPVDCTTTIDNCATVKPSLGILGTPVINVNSDGTGTLYAVTETESGNSNTGFTWYHYLHAVDIQSLTELTGKGSPLPITVPTDNSFSQKHIQRPGLLYVQSSQNGLGYDAVYIAFSMLYGYSSPAPYGAVFAYSAANASSPLTKAAFFQASLGTSSADEGGGIWMDGAGLAFGLDSPNGNPYIYVSTGNGTWNPGSNDYGDSILKLSPKTLTVSDYFTAADQCYRDCNDADLGSGGVTLLPDGDGGSIYYTVSGDKEGGLWFINRSSPGKCVDSTGHTCSATCSCGNGPQKCTPQQSSTIAVYWTGGNGCPGNVVFQATPAFWKNSAEYIFVAPAGKPL